MEEIFGGRRDRFHGEDRRSNPGCLQDYGEKTGVVVCFAAFSTVKLDGGRRVIVLPAYFLERITAALARAEQRSSS
jgi:hypothetical protein